MFVLRRLLQRLRGSGRDVKPLEFHAEGCGLGGRLEPDLDKNVAALRAALGDGSDVVFHEFRFGPGRGCRGAVIYLMGLVDRESVHRDILRALMFDAEGVSADALERIDIQGVQQRLLSATDVRSRTEMGPIVDDILSGFVAVLIDRAAGGLVVNAKQWASRPVDEPKTERLVRGPRVGFTEDIAVNTAMLRRIIRDPGLRVETVTIGSRTRTKVSLVYLQQSARPGLVSEVRRRLASIRIDAVLESGYIEQQIEDSHWSVFATVANTERPDKAAAKILSGRVAILVDGSPAVLTVPALFVESFQTAEDYYSRPLYVGTVRMLRLLSYSLSVISPAAYVALTTFHQELIPTPLLITIATGVERVPFPALVEAGIMVVIYEILREAGIRLPQPIGTSISLVGALVLGQAAVAAGLVSPLMIIVVSLTAIASFAVPAQADSIALLRYLFLVLAGLAGGFGIIMGLLVVLIHLGSLRSFGEHFLAPIAPPRRGLLTDVFVRAPLPSQEMGVPVQEESGE